MVSPRPDPLDAGPLWNRSNARAISSADIPLPVSRTSTAIASPLPLGRDDSYTRTSTVPRTACAGGRSPAGCSAPRGCAPDRPRSAADVPARQSAVSRPVRRLRLRRRRTTSRARASTSADSFWSFSAPPSDSATVRRSSISRDRTCVSSTSTAELTLVRRIHAVQQSFELALNHRQRRAQLVRHVGHQIAAQAIVVLQAFGHRVERARKRAHRRRPVLRHPRRVVARRHAVGALHDGAERQADVPHGEDQRERDGDGAQHDDRDHGANRRAAGGGQVPHREPHHRDHRADEDHQDGQRQQRDATTEDASASACDAPRFPRLVFGATTAAGRDCRLSLAFRLRRFAASARQVRFAAARLRRWTSAFCPLPFVSFVSFVSFVPRSRRICSRRRAPSARSVGCVDPARACGAGS